MNKPNIKYDELSDTLTISFEPGVQATGIELTEHILLRINKFERKAISINLFDYSVLTQKTEMGNRSFPITGLGQLSSEMREIVFDILLHQPVCEYLHLSAYTLSISETIPIVSVQPIPVGIEG
ncbi:DUF2283 domain-containing protein [Argonema antarcticum]|uniref:DUF2283 domain-containing protein n=1 Tax=Argonema antarcticum TaxID=2942763 RepID=UPI0020125EC0|nr:DUF2283 domain-containing protein [Argonema antarcticum]MCL1473981.1 DUF2283 domain-containing protein [Argonema antarcticum A004/B2]